MKGLAYRPRGPLERGQNGRVWWCGALMRSRLWPVTLPEVVGESDRVGQRAFREDGVRREVGREVELGARA